MKVNYKTILEKIKNVLSALNINIFIGNPDVIAIPATAYPCVVVSIDNKKEDITHLGANKRQIELEFKVWVLTRYISYEKSLEELLNLVDVVEETLRRNLTLDGSVNYHNLETTEFGIAAKENTFILGAITTLKTFKQI